MAINVGEEQERKVFDFPVELTEPHRSALLRIAMEEISTEEMDELLLEWVMLKILREKLEEFEETLNTEDREDK